MISFHDLKQYIAKNSIKVTEGELRQMLEELDHVGNGKINYSEFLAATVEAKIFFTEAKIRSVF